MSSHPEKASLTLCSRATVDCRLLLAICVETEINGGHSFYSPDQNS